MKRGYAAEILVEMLGEECVGRNIEALQIAIAHTDEFNGWIRCTDLLPKIADEYEVMHKSGQSDFAWYDGRDWTKDALIQDDICLWRPIDE